MELDKEETPQISNPELQLGPESTIIYQAKEKKYVYISKAPPIKNLVISGGGAKGVILPGVIQAFDEKDSKKASDTLSFKEQLDHIAGSSIGAVTASLLAVGASSTDLVKATESEDFKALLGKGKGPILKSGQPLLELIQKNLKANIQEKLEKIFNNQNLREIENIETAILKYLEKNGKEIDEQKISDLTLKIKKVIDELEKDPASITFSMLEGLHELEPKIFKNLTVTGTCRENGETFYFSAKTTPHLDIATACRASASLPIILTPVKIDKTLLDPGYSAKLEEDGLSEKNFLTFVDGGYLDNVPVSVMEDPTTNSFKGEQGQNLQTLALVFDESNRVEHQPSPFHEVKTKKHALYNSSSMKERLIRDVAARFFAGIHTTQRNTLKKEEGLEIVRKNYTQRNIALLVAIKTSDFEKAKKQEKFYQDRGYKQAKEYLQNHNDELMYQNFESLESLLKAVPEDERQVIAVNRPQFEKQIQDVDYSHA